MALNVQKLMASKYPHLQMSGKKMHSDDLLKETYMAFKEYGKELHTHFDELIKYVENASKPDEQLVESMDSIRDLIKHMQKMDRGEGVTNSQLKTFFEMFHDIMGTLKEFADSQPTHPYVDQTRSRKREMEEAKQERERATEELSRKLGDRFEDVMAKNADVLGSTQANGLRIGLASFLGPAAPLVSLMDGLFDVDKGMAKLTEKIVKNSDDAAKRSKDDEVAERKRSDDEEESRQHDKEYKEEKSWREKMLAALGLVGGKAASNAADGSKGGLLKSLTGGKGGFLSKRNRLVAKSVMSKAAGGLAIAGGAYGLYDSASDLAGNKYKNADGSKKGFTEGGLDSRAGSYGKAAMSGAAMGAGIGSFIPGLGTLVGAGVGAAVGAGVAVVADYKDEIKGFLDETGVTKLFNDGFTMWLNGWKNIGGWIADVGSAVMKSGIMKFMGNKAKDTIKGAVNGIYSIGGFIADIPGNLQLASDYAINAFSDMGSRIKKWYADVKAEVAAFISDPIGYIKNKAAKTASAAGAAVSSAGRSVSVGAQKVGASISRGGAKMAAAVKPYSATASSVIGKGASIAGAAVSGTGKAAGKIAEWAGAGLGALSAKFESGNKGPAAVGYDRTGGASYGTYQIATKTGTMGAFMSYLSKANPDWYARLSKAGSPNDPKGAFAQEWKKIASEDSKGFNDIQHNFIKQTLYDPAVSKIQKATGIDINSKSKVLQDVLWSTAVQHGPGAAATIFSKAISSSGGEGADEKDIINAVYASRSNKFGSSTKAVQASVQARFATEKGMALSALDGGASSVKSASSMPGHASSSVAVKSAGSSSGSEYASVSPLKTPVSTQEAPLVVHNTGGGRPNGGSSMTVDSIPATITDEGLILLNMANLG